MKRKENVILTGFMGCGKTTIGVKLSYRLRMTLEDTDKLIERREKKSIGEIFAQDGEEAFRKMETALLKEIGDRHGKTPAQIILRWNVQQNVIVIPKSVHKERMRENLGIWDFELSAADMAQIASLDKSCPSMLDTRKISEVRRVYDYLRNPVLTSL